VTTIQPELILPGSQFMVLILQTLADDEDFFDFITKCFPPNQIFSDDDACNKKAKKYITAVICCTVNLSTFPTPTFFFSFLFFSFFFVFLKSQVQDLSKGIELPRQEQLVLPSQ
jgi:hypothetical protein